jgi:monofunctional glycosyltransferase
VSSEFHNYTENPDWRPGKSSWKRRLFIGCLASAAAIFLLLLLSIISLRWYNPPFTSFTLREDWEAAGSDRYSLRDWWTPQDELPDHLKWAVIASEDQHFHNHRGFDIESIRDAIEERRTGTRRRGASTISQQVAKNLYLWPGESFVRKGAEAFITLTIEIFWPKERILEVYLNSAEFGPGVFGVGKAAHEFFGISPDRLEPGMSARLAAVLPSPKRMRVEPPTPYTQERSRWILRQMTHLTGILYLPPIADEPKDDPDPLPPGFEYDIVIDRNTFEPRGIMDHVPFGFEFYDDPDTDTLGHAGDTEPPFLDDDTLGAPDGIDTLYQDRVD